MSFDRHIEILEAFARQHLTGIPEEDELILVKLHHSKQVLANAEEIITREGIAGHTAELTRRAALYHDIGRFPQYRQYRSFNDRDSINHARLGVLTLRSIPLPDDMSSNDWRIIRCAVAQHNLKTIRSTLPERVKTPVRVVRDADKLDIFRVMVEHFSSDIQDPVVTHGLSDDCTTYTPEILDTVMRREIGEYSAMRCVNDFKLLVIGWIHCLEYRSSIQILDERGLVDEIFSFLPHDNKIQSLKRATEQFMHYNNGVTP